jgi:hypothetical protein
MRRRCYTALMREQASAPFWTILAEYPHFVLRAFLNPRSLLRSIDFSDPLARQRLWLYAVLWLTVLVLFFADNRRLADVTHPQLSTYKALVMKAHDRSWDWVGLPYAPFGKTQHGAKLLWDTLLTTRFLSYTLLCSLIGMAAVARLRMWRYRLGWDYALGTGLLGHLALTACLALAMVPLTELLICRHCIVRFTLFLGFNVLGWWYLGFYTLGDLGERRGGWFAQATACIGYGLVQYLAAYAVFLVLLVGVIPM